MTARLCVVTGASGALGQATATALARHGERVVMVCRDRSRGESALGQVKAASGSGSVELRLADLSSQESVREFAAGFGREHGRLDLLINNAAIFRQERTVTADSLELMFATNHLGPFLLTNLLLGPLTAGAPSRVINVTAPSTSKLDFADLQSEQKFAALTAFGRSKMCNLLFTYELARRLGGTGVSVNAFHPGLMKSGLMRDAPAVLRGMLNLISARPQKAAMALARLALADDKVGVTGQFFKASKPMQSNPYSRDPAVQAELWLASEKLAPIERPAR